MTPDLVPWMTAGRKEGGLPNQLELPRKIKELRANTRNLEERRSKTQQLETCETRAFTGVYVRAGQGTDSLAAL